MATLTDADFTAHKRALRQDPVARADLKAAGLTKAQWKAALQAVEDRFEEGRAGLKSAIDLAAGTTLTSSMAKKLGKVWMQQKVGGE